MILTVDCGNSRLKWGLGDARPAGQIATWHAKGESMLAQIPGLNATWRGLAGLDRVLVANVAGELAREALAAALHGSGVPVEWVASSAVRGGVSNSYATPQRLGVDRWAALIGARHLCVGHCLVVMAGTATTVDVLGADGVFQGGVILPGADLMKRALADGTAGLPYAAGQVVDAPRNSEDAIESGCTFAQIGAIEYLYRRLPAGAACLLSGGAVASIASRLTFSCQVIDNLVLEGLVVMGGERQGGERQGGERQGDQ